MTLAQLQAEANRYGITEVQAAEYGNIRHKTTWQRAIDDELQLREEMAEAEHQQAAAAAYQSPSAPVVVPLALGAALGEALLRNAHGFLTRK